MARTLKEYLAKDLEAKYTAGGGFVAVDFQGLDAAETVDLRTILRQVGGRMHVVPNRIALRVVGPTLASTAPGAGGDGANGNGDLVARMFRGPTAMLIGETGGVDSVAAVSKVVVEWRKKNADKVGIKGAYADGLLLEPEKVFALAELPDQKTLYSMVAGLFQSPLRDTVSVVQQTIARMVYALAAYAKKLEEEGGGGE